jgi:hypothetical protein
VLLLCRKGSASSSWTYREAWEARLLTMV